MALVTDGWWLTVEFIDNGANRTTRTIQMRAADYATATTDAATIIAALEQASDAVLTSYAVRERFVEDNLLLPGVGVQIENIALMQMEITGNPLKTATFAVPAPNPAVFVSTSGANANVIDTASATITPTYNLFENTGGVAYISDGETATDFLGGKRIHRKSRRG